MNPLAILSVRGFPVSCGKIFFRFFLSKVYIFGISVYYGYIINRRETKMTTNKICTEYMWETCTGSSPASITYNHYGVPMPMCEDCYEWLHGRLDPIKIK
jgi:hypothetical protein